jgi:addiction module RelE/StbE family toxin
MKTRWTRTALADVRSLPVYVSADNPTAAEDILEGLSALIHHLRQHPDMGRKGRWKGSVPGTRELVMPPYVIAYRVRGYEISLPSFTAPSNGLIRCNALFPETLIFFPAVLYFSKLPAEKGKHEARSLSPGLFVSCGAFPRLDAFSRPKRLRRLKGRWLPVSRKEGREHGLANARAIGQVFSSAHSPPYFPYRV